jgi:ABC-type spermidine/putrescine transport system permease subunit I
MPASTPIWTKLRIGPRSRFVMLCAPGALFILLCLVLPLLSIVVFSFWRTESYQLIVDWNLENYAAVLGDSTYLTFLGRSLLMALVVSIICLIYAWPVAYLIARRGGRYRLILVLLTAAPFFTGIILRITAMQQILGPIGLVNMGLSNFGLPMVDALMYTNVASAIGLVYLWIPFMVLAIYLSLLNFNFELLEVAQVNGARPWRAFWEITWPLNWMGTAIGIVLVFTPTLAANVTPRFLGGPNGALFGNILANQFGATGTWALGSAMGVVLFAISILVLLIVWRTVNLQRSGFTGAGGEQP